MPAWVADRFIQRGSRATIGNFYADARRLVTLHFKGGGRESGIGAFAPQPIMIAQSETESIFGDAPTRSWQDRAASFGRLALGTESRRVAAAFSAQARWTCGSAKGYLAQEQQQGAHETEHTENEEHRDRDRQVHRDELADKNRHHDG